MQRQGGKRAAALIVQASGRDLPIDTLAYPINGVPEFVALANSATRPLVLAIARQESAFDATAHSGAGDGTV